MRSLTSLTLALCAVTAAAALKLEPRQGTASLDQATCGRVSYSRQHIDSAVTEGCRLHAAGKQVGGRGGSGYPHHYSNFEGLDFAAAGPYLEFPILNTGGLYTGDSSPGADRVIFNPNLNGSCVYVGAITHTGATGSNFLSCSESMSASDSTATATTSFRPSSTLPTRTAMVTTATTSTTTSTLTSTADVNGAQQRVGAVGGSGLVMGVVAGVLLL